VFDAASPPGLDLEPQYLRKGRNEAPMGSCSPFPAQIKFARLHDFAPLEERKFCHLVEYNAGTNVFRHRLSESRTKELLRLLANPEEAPADNRLPYESNGYVRIPEKPNFYEMKQKLYGTVA
jgi:hypothetical protein